MSLILKTQMTSQQQWDLPVSYTGLHWKERKNVREQYIEEQNGLCHWCLAPLKGKPSLRVRWKKIDKRLFPETMFKYPVHLQHNHYTGLTEGAVHAHCNAVMWQYHGK